MTARKNSGKVPQHLDRKARQAKAAAMRLEAMERTPQAQLEILDTRGARAVKEREKIRRKINATK